MNLADYQALVNKADTLKRKAERAAGAVEQLKLQLKRDFSCSTLEEGKKLLTKLEQEEMDAKTDFDKALKAFKANWNQELGDEL